ncbi:MAG: mechanosensitive ion channel family protein [Polyangiaceae bacterium]
MKRVSLLLVVLVTSCVIGILPARAWAIELPTAPQASNAPPTTVVEEPTDEASPRATVSAFWRLCRSGDFASAARYLDLPKSSQGQGPLLARRLKAVLDRKAWIDLETLSPLEKGNLDDGLPHAFEDIAKIPGDPGHPEPVRLYKRPNPGDGPAWVFSRTTVEHINGWYTRLDQRWMLEHLPPSLLRPGPKELLVWQWIALPILFMVFWEVSRLLSNVTRWGFGKLAARTRSSWDDALVAKLGGPLRLVWTLVLTLLVVPWLGLYLPAAKFVQSLISGGFYFAFFWVVSRLIEVWGHVAMGSPWASEHSAAKSLVPIGVRLGQIAVLAIAVVALVSALGYPAASLIAGLGVGGLAIALAAQKTVENLFGAFTLGFDQPFRVGDFVKVEDFVGTVESIGLRSTKIRTLDRTVITIPNGKLSEMRLESFAPRDRIRLAGDLALDYGTSVEQMQTVVEKIGDYFRAHPNVEKESVVVWFKELGKHALLVELQVYFLTAEWGEFQRLRQAALFELMRIIEGAGAKFAFPTQTVHLVSESDPKQKAAEPRGLA